MDIVKKEIKEALLGDLVSMDRRLVVSGMMRVKYRNGLRDGFGSVFILGVMCSRRWYMTKKSAKQVRELAVKAMQDMGRMLLLQSLPEAEAVYCTYLLNHPCILTFTQGKDGIIEITAYSARDFSGMLATYRTLNRFQKALRGILERMSEEGEQKKLNAIREQDQKEKQAKQQAKLDKKQAKQQAKLDKKQAKQQAKLDKKQDKQDTNQDNRQEIKKNIKQEVKQSTILAFLQENVKLPFADRLKKNRQDQGAKKTEEQVEEQTAKRQKEAEMQTQSAAAVTEPAQTDFAVAQAAATEAKLVAEAAEARLAAAEARLAAEQAQAKLARMQAQLAATQALQSNAAAQAPQSNAAAQAETAQMTGAHDGTAEEHQGGSDNRESEHTNADGNSSSNNSNNNINRNSNSRKKNRKKKK